VKKLIIASIAVFALAGSSALAADLPVKALYKAPPAPPVATWTGCYIGGNVGGGWAWKRFANPSDSNIAGDRGEIDEASFVGGVQAGCDFQTGAWVFGAQGMYDWADIKGQFVNRVNPLFSENAHVRSYATFTGRIGYAVTPAALIYVKGGLAWVRDHHDDIITATGAVDATADLTRSGWVIGFGGEYMFAPGWSAFVEYNYLDFGTERVPFTGAGVVPFSFQIEQSVQAIMVGINYRFGGGSLFARF
jgi:outer membrane immunogenic protein